MWDAVRVITGRRQELPAVEGVTAESLNQHYVKISTDAHYQQPKYKTAVTQSFDECRYMSDWNMFRILDSLPHTATGLDNLPSWFYDLAHLYSATLWSDFLTYQLRRYAVEECCNMSSP